MSGFLVSTDEILAAFREAFVSLPVDEIGLAVERWEDMAALLLERIERMAPEDEALVWVAIYLMAQQRETRAFPVLCGLGRGRGAQLRELLGDGVFEDLGTILARVFDGHADVLCALIEDEAADEAIRAAAIPSLAHLVREERLTLVWARDLLQRLAPALRRKSEGFLAGEWLSAIIDMQLVDLVPLAEAAFADGRIDKKLLDVKEFRAEMRAADDAYQADAASQYAEFDAVDRLSAFTTGGDDESEGDDDRGEIAKSVVNPLRNVGRNDPCICGSGKKFKKCCLGK